MTAKKRLQLQETSIKEQTAKLDEQARQAMVAGREDLARAALERKHLAEGKMQSLDQQVAQLEDQQHKLTDSEQKLNAKVEAYRTKKEVIKAQYSAAEAQVQISAAATGVGEEMADVGLAMQRALEKTEDMKAHADGVSSSRPRARSRTSPSWGRHRTTSTASSNSWGARTPSTRTSPSSRPSSGKAPNRRRSSTTRRGGRGRRSDDHPHLQRRAVRARAGARAASRARRRNQSAVSLGDSERFHNAYDRLLEHIRTEGTRLGTDDLRPSDLLLPPADSSVIEVARELQALELIPG